MTQNDATLLAAFGAVSVSAFISALVARYTVKYGPDYQKQLNDLRAEMARISTANEGMLAHQKQMAGEENARREAMAWRPGKAYLRSDRATRSNALLVFADRDFAITRVDICTESGVTVESVTVSNPEQRLVKRAEFDLPTSAIERLVAPDPAYQQHSKTVGKLLYELTVGTNSQRLEFELPFRAIREMDGPALWPRLEG